MTEYSNKLALYFGYRSGGGHYLQDHRDPYWSATSKSDYKDDFKDLHWNIGHMDGGLLKNGKHPDIYDGKVFWTCGGRLALWFAFFWWDNSGDKRGASNSGFYVRGFEFPNKEDAFAYACQCYPDIIKRQTQTLVIQEK